MSHLDVLTLLALSSEICENEITDYVHRAPRRFHLDGKRLVNNTHARFTWLASLARGTIDEKINRRAGIPDDYRPWHDPVAKSVERNRRKGTRRAGARATA